MNKTLSTVGSVLALTLLLGAGCGKASAPETTTPQVKPAETATTPVTIVPAEETAVTTGLMLTAASLGEKNVLLNWTVSEEIAGKAEAYRMVLGKDANPTWPTMYRYERGPSFRDKLWKDLPLGTQHFRVCAVVGGECSVYSNDVTAEVKE